MFVSAPRLSLTVADAQATGSVTAEATKGAQSLVYVRAGGDIVVHVPSVRKLAADFAFEGPLPRDVETLGKMELTGNWRFDGGALAVKPLAIQLDGTHFAGWVECSAPPVSAWRFELHGDRVDLGRYVDVESVKKRKPFELPVEALRALNATGSVIFDEAQLADARMKDVRLRVQSPDEKP
jgi:hypothetical protein